MATLTNEQRLGEITGIRVKIKTHAALRQDITTAIQDILKKHGVPVEEDLQKDFIVALPEEIDGQLSNVVLPGGTNC